MKSFIRVDRLSKHFGKATALDAVSLDVEQGEFIALLGPSGCGKTTLLRMIAGFIEPDSGEIFIDGQAMARRRPNERPVNTVFQHYALFPHYTVFDNIAFGPRRRSTPESEIRTRVAEALKVVNMEDFAGRFPAQLSGGQQQRVALARAIINRPKVLLLDEPLGALDLKLRKHMQMELKRLHSALGITFVFVTHDQEEALSMADRIAVLQAGKVLQIGTGEDIYLRPNSRYVADFIGEANLLPCSVTASGSVEVQDEGIVVMAKAPQAMTGACTLLLRPESLEFGAPVSSDEFASMDVVIERQIFMGNASRVYARTPGGKEIVLHLPTRSGAMRSGMGATTTIRWHRHDAVLLPA